MKKALKTVNTVPTDADIGAAELLTPAKDIARPIVITNSEFRFVVAEQLRDCAISAHMCLTLAPRLGARYGVAVAELAAAIEGMLEVNVLIMESEQEVFTAMIAVKEGRGAFADALVERSPPRWAVRTR